MIRSKMHKLLELLPESELRRDFQQDPLYVFANEVLELLVMSESSAKSIQALAECGLVHLPYPKMTAQFNVLKEKGGTWFVSLRERDDGTFFTGTTWLSHQEDAWLRPVFTEVRAEATGMKCEVADRSSDETGAYAAAVAVRACCLMIHIQGLDREETPSLEKLNRAREARGRPLVQPYSYIHVGRVWDSEGRVYERGSPTGRYMPIHMRAGHVRRQHYGPGRAEVKTIWIPPVLVNYQGEERPVLERRVVV